MLRTIRLYGELGKKYGKVHKLHVDSVAEAVRALSANFKDFKHYLIDSDKRIAGYEVWDGKQNLSEDDRDAFHLKNNGDIKIIPRVVGASNATRIIAGVIFVAIVTWATWGTGGPWAAGTAAGWTAAANFGVAMILSGVTGLMAQTSSGSSIDSNTENTESYIFSGPVNTTKQGNPVHIGYGKMIVGSQVISASLTTADIPI